MFRKNNLIAKLFVYNFITTDRTAHQRPTLRQSILYIDVAPYDHLAQLIVCQFLLGNR